MKMIIHTQRTSSADAADEFALTPPPEPRPPRRRLAAHSSDEAGAVHLLYRDFELLQFRRSLRPDKLDGDSKIWNVAEQLPDAPRLLPFGASPEQDFFKRLLQRFPNMRELCELQPPVHTRQQTATDFT